MSEADHMTARKGRAAQQEFELTEAAFASLRTSALEALVKCPPDNLARMNRLIACVQTVDAVKEALLKAVREGEDAKTMADHTQRMIDAGIIDRG